MRLISGLLLLLGLAVAAYGGFRLLGDEETQNSVAHAPEPDPVQVIAPEPSAAPASLPAPVLQEAPSPEGFGVPEPDSNSAETAADKRAEDAMDEPVMTVQSATGNANAPEPSAQMRERRLAVNGARRSADSASFAERLYQVPVAYETPKTAAFREPFNVTFAIDGTGDTTAVNALPGRDTNVVSDTAKISDRVKASLIGSSFEIKLLSPEVQRVSLLTENVWRWQVTPIEAGEHPLVLELFALEGDEAVPLRTFSDEVVVSVSSFQRVVSLATTANPIFVVLGGLGSALGGFFGLFKFFRRVG